VKVTKKTLVMSAMAVLVAGTGVIMLADAAQALTTCDRMVLMAGTVDPAGTYGYSGIPTAGGDRSCRLHMGVDTGTDAHSSPVWWLQRTLNECYGASLVLDGAYGPKTAEAVKAAQATVRGLERDGVYGPRTRNALKWYTERSTSHGGTLAKCLPYGSLK
jgi:hypothetical protein